MRTLQGMRMNVAYMMEKMRSDAISETFEKFKEADKRYYETSEGGEIVTRLFNELDELGADMVSVIETDLQIRDEVFGI